MTPQEQNSGKSESYKYISSIVNISSTPDRIRDLISLQPCENKVLADKFCWSWQGSVEDGYPRLSWPGFKTQRAHRIVYALLVGEIPTGFELDHLCLNTICVNPNHLEPVTRLENLRRSHTTGRGNGTRTHCRQGHEFTPENIYSWRGKRFCLKCQAFRQAEYEKRKLEGAA